MPKKKPGALLAIAIGPKGGLPKKGPSPSYDEEEAEPGMDEGEGDHEVAFGALADAMGIAPEKRATAQAALKSFVRTCMQEYGSGG